LSPSKTFFSQNYEEKDKKCIRNMIVLSGTSNLSPFIKYLWTFHSKGAHLTALTKRLLHWVRKRGRRKSLKSNGKDGRGRVFLWESFQPYFLPLIFLKNANKWCSKSSFLLFFFFLLFIKDFKIRINQEFVEFYFNESGFLEKECINIKMSIYSAINLHYFFFSENTFLKNNIT